MEELYFRDGNELAARDALAPGDYMTLAEAAEAFGATVPEAVGELIAAHGIQAFVVRNGDETQMQVLSPTAANQVFDLLRPRQSDQTDQA